MRMLSLAVLAFVGFMLPVEVVAQEMAEDGPYWYVTHYRIPWARVDSLVSLERTYSPRVRESITPEQTNILDRKVLIHDTGPDWNVVVMTKFSSWSAIREDAPVNLMEHVFPDEAERTRIQEAYAWVYEGAEHWDAIYRESEEITP